VNLTFGFSVISASVLVQMILWPSYMPQYKQILDWAGIWISWRGGFGKWWCHVCTVG